MSLGIILNPRLNDGIFGQIINVLQIQAMPKILGFGVLTLCKGNFLSPTLSKGKRKLVLWNKTANPEKQRFRTEPQIQQHFYISFSIK